MVTFDTNILTDIVKRNGNMYKNFFNNDSNEKANKLLENNKFEELFEIWPNTCASLTALLLLSNINFLDYLSSLPNECFYGLPIIQIEIPSNIHSIMNSEDSGLAFGNKPGAFMFKRCDKLKTIKFNKTEDEVFNMFDVNDTEDLISRLFGSDVNVEIIYK